MEVPEMDAPDREVKRNGRTEARAWAAGGVAFRVFIAAAVAGLAAYGVNATLGVGGSGLTAFFTNWVYHGIVLGATAACVARAILVPAERGVWISLSAGLAAWLAGSVYYAASGAALDSSPPSPISDVLFLLFYPAASVALALLVRARVRPVQASVLLDGALAALAVVAVGAGFAFQSLATATGNLTVTRLDLAYPLGDLMLLTLVIWVLDLTGWRPKRMWVFVVGGLSLAGLASGVHVYEIAAHTYVSGTITESLWPVAALLVAYAAWRSPEKSVSIRLEGSRRLVVPTASALVALALLVYSHFSYLNNTAVALAVATLLVLIVRATVTSRENLNMLTDMGHDALTDFLTGLHNRRKLMIDLREQLKVASVSSPSILVLFDLDGFKRYNDTYGHPAGDVLLSRLGGRLTRAIQPYGAAYRIGGDEFCALVTTGASSSRTIISVAAAALSETGEGFTVKSSYGAVILPHEARDPALALRIADQRMYAQKDDNRSSATRQTRDILVQILHEREPDLGDHLRGVAKLAMGVGSRLALPSEELDEVVRAAELHDVGKMAIPDEILHKPGPLDDDERSFVHQHTVIGERILEAAPALLPVAKLVRSSHEHYDGGGYPDGAAGEAIPLGARIVAVCDAFDAMTSGRPYQTSMSAAEALAELRSCAGSQFDPAVVDAFCAEVEKLAPEVAASQLTALPAAS